MESKLPEHICLLFSVLITGVITDAIKDAVGRPCPDFFWRCLPEGKGVFDPVTSNVVCTGVKKVIKEGHKSFPSGHTSWSSAALVGVSRVVDYRHHWQDVFTGGILGLSMASFCYLQFFPPPYGINGWGPHAYFQMLAEPRNVGQTSSNSSCLNVQQSELQSIQIDSQHSGETSGVITQDRRPILEGNVRNGTGGRL